VVFPPFFYANNIFYFRYIGMIRVIPTNDEQRVDIIPRRFIQSENLEESTVVVTIIEEGTRKTETLTNLSSQKVGNFLRLLCGFTILTAENVYSIEVKSVTETTDILMYRDKLYCTSQQSINGEPHTLNQDKYSQFDGDTDTQKYIII